MPLVSESGLNSALVKVPADAAKRLAGNSSVKNLFYDFSLGVVNRDAVLCNVISFCISVSPMSF